MKYSIRLAVTIGLLAATSIAQAVVMEFTIDGKGNDCVGYYSSDKGGFDSCVIASEDTGEGISSIIAKWEMDSDGEGEWEVSDNFPDFNTDLVTFDPINPDGGRVGSWAYSADQSPIRYWVIKHGKAFTVYYDTDNERCAGVLASTHECMTTANQVNGGDWDFSNLRGGFSHISFYDSEVVPEPGTLLLFGLGLLGLAASGRYQRRA